jgi:hypothetical protein
MSDPDNDERVAQLMRYRLLQHEATDPLATRLMADIIKELETELENVGIAQTSTKPERSK